MRKILKGISLFAITIIVGCLFINCVNAETRSGSVHSSVTTKDQGMKLLNILVKDYLFIVMQKVELDYLFTV